MTDRIRRRVDRLPAGRPVWVEAVAGDLEPLTAAVVARFDAALVDRGADAVPDGVVCVRRPATLSTSVIDELLRRIDAGRPVVVIAGRARDATGLRARVAAEGTLDLEPTRTLVELAADVAARGGGDDAAPLAWSWTGGLAHLVDDAVDAAITGDSTTLDARIADALDRLDPAHRHEVLVAGLLGRSVDAGAQPAADAVGLLVDGRAVGAVGLAAGALGADEALAVARDVIAAATDRRDPVPAADALLALPGVAGLEGATDVLARAAEHLAAIDPHRSLALLDRIGAGADPTRVRALLAAGRVEDALDLVDSASASAPADRAVLGCARASALAHAAHFAPAVTAYASVDPPGDLAPGALADVVAATAGLVVRETASASSATSALAATAFAAAARAARDHDAVDDLVRSAALAEHAPLHLWPDTPHVLALTAAVVGGSATEGVPEPPRTAGVVHTRRSRCWQGWAALAAGRWTDAEAVITDLDDVALPTRDRLRIAALAVAMAVRAGDAATVAACLEPALREVRIHPVELTAIPALAEIAVAAAVVRNADQARRLLEQLAAAVDLLPATAPWRAAVALPAAVVAALLDDAALAARAADLVRDAPARPAVDGARLAPEVIAGRATRAEVEGVGDRLARVGAVFEAATLVGAAARASTDDADAKALVVTARKLRRRLPGRGAEEGTGVGALSDRELEVARALVAGATHREISEQLFISRKTVEHHAAHIRTKIGAADRREMLAMLGALLG